MGKETLAIPEEYVKEVIQVIRGGLDVITVSEEVRDGLNIWCDNMEDEELEISLGRTVKKY